MGIRLMAKFVKGQSGNPGGRPKAAYDLQELARERTLKALDTLTTIMESEDAPPAARVGAACALLDRAYGKPVQMTEITGRDGGPIETKELSDMELAREVAFLLTSAVKQQEATH